MSASSASYGHSARIGFGSLVPKPAVSSCSNVSGKTALFDDLVGAGNECSGNGKSDCICRLEVDNQLELGRLHDRQIGRVRALKNPARIDSRLPISIER